MDSMNITRSCYVYGILVISLELLMLMISNISNKSKQFWKYVFKRSKVKGSQVRRAVPPVVHVLSKNVTFGQTYPNSNDYAEGQKTNQMKWTMVIVAPFKRAGPQRGFARVTQYQTSSNKKNVLLSTTNGHSCPLPASWPTARWAPRRGTCWSRTAPVARRGGARSSSISLERLSRFRHLYVMMVVVMVYREVTVVMVMDCRREKVWDKEQINIFGNNIVDVVQYCDHLRTTVPPSPLIGLLLAK